MSARVASVAFGVTAAAAVGFAWTYALGAQVQLEGLFAGVALAGLAVGFAAWAQDLPSGPYVEERPALPSTAAQEAALSIDLREQDTAIRTAGITRRMLTVALGALGLAALFPLRSLLWKDVQPLAALARTPWGDGVHLVDGEGNRVRVADLDVGTALTVYPEGHRKAGDASVMLVRVPPSDLRLPADRRGWVVDGLVAYSKLCTHAGCPVGLFVQGAGELMCPCHQSIFDVLDGARPIAGPAARPLPQLPLGVGVDGTLVARGDFPDPVGPGYWRKQ